MKWAHWQWILVVQNPIVCIPETRSLLLNVLSQMFRVVPELFIDSLAPGDKFLMHNIERKLSCRAFFGCGNIGLFHCDNCCFVPVGTILFHQWWFWQEEWVISGTLKEILADWLDVLSAQCSVGRGQAYKRPASVMSILQQSTYTSFWTTYATQNIASLL